MPSESTLDFDALLSPISEDQPAGNYLRRTDYDRFQNAKDLRTAAVAAERKIRELAMYTEEDLEMLPEQDRDIPRPDWRAVREACLEILESHSKDLWVGSWLVEANLRVHGFAGLRDGFLLVQQIAVAFWDQINPPPDEDEGYLGTVSQLTGLNGEDGPGTLVDPIAQTSLLPGYEEINLAAYRQATEGGASGQYNESEMQSVARQADTDSLRALGEDLEQALEAFNELDSALMERCGEYEGRPVAPPTSQIRREIEECLRVFRSLTKDVLSDESTPGMDDGHTEPGDSSDDSTGQTTTMKVDPAKNQVASREEAFKLLLRASEFFRKTEPHSPVSYMLQQAVRFGRMELPDLLKELITDDDVLKRFAERTGIELPEPEDDY